MVIRLSLSCQNTWGLQSNNDAKLAATPHWRSMVLVEQVTQRIHWKFERASKAVHEQLSINLYTTSINRGSQSLHVEKWQITLLIYTSLEHNKKYRCPRCPHAVRGTQEDRGCRRSRGMRRSGAGPIQIGPTY
jgi:hypothetical protein